MTAPHCRKKYDYQISYNDIEFGLKPEIEELLDVDYNDWQNPKIIKLNEIINNFFKENKCINS